MMQITNLTGCVAIGTHDESSELNNFTLRIQIYSVKPLMQCKKTNTVERMI